MLSDRNVLEKGEAIVMLSHLILVLYLSESRRRGASVVDR